MTIDLRRLSGRAVNVWWYDPLTGRSSFGGTHATSGDLELEPPQRGSWALVIDDAALNLRPPVCPTQ